MKNRSWCLFISFFLSMPSGYLCAAAELDEELTSRFVVVEMKKDAFDQQAIFNFLEEDDEERKNEPEEVVAAGAIVIENLPPTPLARYAFDGVSIKRISSNKELAKLAENYEKYTTVEQVINVAGPVHLMAIAPNGKSIAIQSRKKIVVYNIESGALLNSFECLNSWIISIAFSPDGKYFVVGFLDGTVGVWDVVTNKYLYTLDHYLQTPEQCQNLVQLVTFSSDGQHIITGDYYGTVCVWDVNTGKFVRVLDGRRQTESIVLSPDERYVAFGYMNGDINILSFETGEYLLTLKGHQGVAWSGAFSFDGQYFVSGSWVVSGSWDNTVRIWRVATGECLHLLKGHQKEINSVAFSPNGRYVVSGSTDNTVRIWHAEKGECVGVLEKHHDKVSAVAFSSDGQYIISGSEDETIRIWDISKIINE